ncbi:MAG: formate--tetrahydrofolate ligase [Rickettsiales bacterium]|jgi:formate--tetrahydrofolate ligase|nr:formate--tetrahydrofolate ligase [Rickettsiales bacterium]
MTDIAIARGVKLSKITALGARFGLGEDDLELFGSYRAKISPAALERIGKSTARVGKLILVTAMNPTPSGEGKTTLTIGLGQGLAKLGKKTMLALREPSLGPCFGLKGGATGGGYSQVAPREDINLHFTGDIHAISAAHNLIAALVDSHINFGNPLAIDTVSWRRALDVNDRALRNVIVGVGENSGSVREDGFMITAASELMAIVCLSRDMADLKERLARVLLGTGRDGKNITLGDLGAVGSVAVLLRDALRPNLVQTLEGVPTLVHGGPFANIAHGCNSIVATKTALKLADYVVTEAGFGADLGAEKFFDIKCREAALVPGAVVLVATCRALKYNGGVSRKNLGEENREAIRIGASNLSRHVENIGKYGLPVVVALNRFDCDGASEIELVRELCGEMGARFALCEAWSRGGDGALDLATEVMNALEQDKNGFRPLYGLEMPLEAKVETIAREIYRARKVVFSARAAGKLRRYGADGFGGLPVCIAKTQYSFSDDPTLLGAPEDFTLNIGDVSLSAGAGFVVCLAGDIVTMPGLPPRPNALAMDVDENGDIVGLF